MYYDTLSYSTASYDIAIIVFLGTKLNTRKHTNARIRLRTKCTRNDNSQLLDLLLYICIFLNVAGLVIEIEEGIARLM